MRYKDREFEYEEVQHSTWPYLRPYSYKRSGSYLIGHVYRIFFEETEVEVLNGSISLIKQYVHMLNTAYNLGMERGGR